MKFAGLLCSLAGLVQLGSSAAIIDRDEDAFKYPYVLRHYEDTEPAKNYCKGDAPLTTDECRQYSNTTVLVDDCIDLIWVFRGNSSRFEYGNGGNLHDPPPPLPAVAFGTCVFSLVPKPYTSDWMYNMSLGSLDIEQVVFKSILRSSGQLMHATCGTLRNCTGHHFTGTVEKDLRFLIHNAQVDHISNPTVDVSIGFPTETSHSVPTPAPIRP